MKKLVLLIAMLLSFVVQDSYASFSYTSAGGSTRLTVPAGSTGRIVSLYNTSGNSAYSVTSGDTSAVIGTITTGTYFWRITDTDGTTFLDNSDWGTITNGTEWTWANSSLAKDATWNMVVAGDSDSDGNCIDSPDVGCYMKLQRNGSDYMFMGPRLGSDLAAGKQVLASAEYEPGGVPNASFESGTGVDADSWTESGDADRVSDKSFLGTWSMKFVAPTSAQATTSTAMTIEAGTNYTLWARIYNGMNGTGDNHAYVDLNDILGECNTLVSPSSNWQEVSCNFNVSATSVTLRLVTHGTATNTGSVWFDGIRLVKGNTNTITWTSLTNTTATPAANDLKKTSGTANTWDADAISTQTISAFVSGYGMSTKVGQTNGILMIGLSSDDPNADWSSIDYAINPSSNGLIYIYENGVYKSATYGCGNPAYTTSDVFSIVLDSSGKPDYRKNNVSLCSDRTTQSAPTYPLFVDTSIFTSNASFINVKLVNSSISTADGDGMARRATDESSTTYKDTRWLENTASNQWICVDLGSSATFDRVHLIQRDYEGYGGNSISIQVSSSDDGCVNNFSTISGATISRPQNQTLTIFTFSPQTKRYVRMYFTSSFTRPEAHEIEIYNEEESGSLYGDIENLVLYGTDNRLISIPVLQYDSYTNNTDGSVTLIKNGIKSQSGTCGTINCLDITVNYKKMSNDAWRKRITLNYDVAARVSMQNVLHRGNVSDTCIKVDSDSSSSCSTANNDTKYFQMSAISIPYVFGLVPDNGCTAKWTLLNGTHTSAFSDSMEVSGFDDSTQWREAYVTYGKQCGASASCDGKTTLEIAANTDTTFDVGIFRSLDPIQFKVRQKAPISLADIKDKLGLSELDRLLWASAYQLFRIPRTTKQDYCAFFSGQGYTGSDALNGYFHADNTHITYALGDQAVARKVIMTFGKASNVTVDIINEDDSFSQSPPTLVGGSKNSIWSGLMLGHAYKKGYISFSTNSACGETDNSCVLNSVRDNVCTALDGAIASDGWTYDNISTDSFIDEFKINNNLTDSKTAWMMLLALAYRGIKETGASCFSQTKLDNLMTNIASLYDATDGYIHFSRYGHWQPRTDAGANGGTYYEGMGDYIAPATARFVVPSGSNQSLTIHYRKAPNTSGCTNGCYGKIIIKKNGTAVTQSPIDLYSASESFTSTAITETVSSGDVLTFEVANFKNASSNGYKISLDAIVIGGTTYQETDSNFACGSLGSDCLNGYTRGWKRWKNTETLLYEAILDSTYNESFFTDAQIISHIEHLPSGNMGNGSLLGQYQKQDDTCVDTGYWVGGESACKVYSNGGSWFQQDAATWNLVYKTASNPLIWYKWDEKSDKLTTTGTWSNETDSANYYQQYVWKSTIANDYIVFSGVPFTDAEVYMQSPASCVATVFFDNGSGYDAGTTANTTNPVYTKTGQAYSWGYKIKVRVDSGTCRLDYIKAKSKALDMLNFRLAEEFVKEPSGKEFLVSDYYRSDYRNTQTGRGNYYLGWNILYRGGILTNYPKFRGMFEGIYYRRIN